MWRVVVNEVVGDILGPLELYVVEPVGEHGQVHVEDNAVAPAREQAVNRVLVAVVGRELIRGMIEHPCVHALLACPRLCPCMCWIGSRRAVVASFVLLVFFFRVRFGAYTPTITCL